MCIRDSRRTESETAAVKEIDTEGLLWFLLFGGLFYFMMRYGCGAHMVHGHGEHTGHGIGEGGHTDPVCGMTVAVDQGLVTSRSPEDLPAFLDKMLEEIAEGRHAGQTA